MLVTLTCILPKHGEDNKHVLVQKYNIIYHIFADVCISDIL